MKLQTPARPATPVTPASMRLGPRAVSALLHRHGVPESQHSNLVAHPLDFKYAAAHRRMNGSVASELEELEQLATHFGEDLARLFDDADSDSRERAVLVSAGARVPCLVVLGPRIESIAGIAFDPTRLVATQLGVQWVVQPAVDVGAGPHFEVRSLIVEPALSDPSSDDSSSHGSPRPRVDRATSMSDRNTRNSVLA